jgi:predicted RNase H-like HicB family nuclease
MGFDDYKVVLYRQDDGSWVAEIPAVGGCYALMDTREAALAELEQVFALIAQEYQDGGRALPKGTTEVVNG